MQTVLFALLHSRIAGKEPCLFQRAAKLRICGEQRAGDAVTNRARLAGRAAAVDVDVHVILFGKVRENQGRTDDHLEGFETEILVDVTLVDRDVAGAGEKTNARDGLLASAGADVSDLCHCRSPFRLLELQRLRLLCFVVVIRTCVNAELLEHLRAKRAFRHHAADGLVNRELRLLLEQGAIVDFLDSARETGVVDVGDQLSKISLAF